MYKIKISKSELTEMISNIVKNVLKEDINIPSNQQGIIKNKIDRRSKKIFNLVNKVNELISQAIDSDGDPIGVIDHTSTYEMPVIYEPIIYGKNGQLKIVSRDLHSKTPDVQIIRMSDMEYEGIPTLQYIGKLYRYTLKHLNDADDTNESINEVVYSPELVSGHDLDTKNKALLQSFVSTMPENVPEMWQKIQQEDFSKGEAWFALEDQILKIYSKNYGNSKAKAIHNLLLDENYNNFYFSLLDDKFGQDVIKW